ncbi:prephenate dehydrogenase [Aneurinibacillus migulanus]|uniref:prephenate dehydrogenase n=1 Tax=Aneurinibacillus migulanus TaxID=47500 RepID=UPI0005B9D050|nr:prephenate dehydrogenase [Aneurinibacillus migulanus]KIV54440.1 prephenate dehydrogenase [Aneurinibacillus migulanus]KPD06836.1 prephenate dehydrogenase [Aneurinibacillus migulanus]MCP1354156.1 prephenate dehydrogenase [Aneurinibacillus migulanus]MED4728048.1 prephenate dehydrogenase [Aneurinibacillus migulanus]CEH30027.1 Prephenate dehydrogenase [Aneurinibacillus migulanus]
MTEIAILGVGLIGGSLALSLRKNEDVHITGFDVVEENLRMARSLGVIDSGTTHLAEAVAQADYIFLCAPVGKLQELISFLRYTPLKEGAVISDTGSTKVSVMEHSHGFAQRGVYFIGGHPMAGSHKSGVEASHDRLFENAYYVLTPAEDTPTTVTERLRELLVPTHAKVVVMNAQRHDEVVGAISHFPHIIASALVNQVASYSEADEMDWYRSLAAGGFRDITRIASSNPGMWRDILLNNRPVMKKMAEDLKQIMERISVLIERADGPGIERFFAEARTFRNALPEKKKGALQPYFDLYVDIPDEPGVIARVTTLLGKEKISITNISILETREDILGVLRISFRSHEDMEKATHILKDEGYSVYERE